MRQTCPRPLLLRRGAAARRTGQIPRSVQRTRQARRPRLTQATYVLSPTATGYRVSLDSTGEERRRFGKDHEEKAATAVARTLICIAWAVMARGQDYADAGED
jgi:hypothetical protein